MDTYVNGNSIMHRQLCPMRSTTRLYIWYRLVLCVCVYEWRLIAFSEEDLARWNPPPVAPLRCTAARGRISRVNSVFDIYISGRRRPPSSPHHVAFSQVARLGGIFFLFSLNSFSLPCHHSISSTLPPPPPQCMVSVNVCVFIIYVRRRS